MDMLDTSLIGPGLLFLNQYFNFFFDEYYILWICLVSTTFASLFLMRGPRLYILVINLKERPK